MNSHWSQEKFYKAFSYAAAAHNKQKIPGSELPYIVHVASVCAELMAVVNHKINNDLLLQCAALHDILEDTDVKYIDLKVLFGKAVADGVQALTKDRTLDKSLQIVDSIDRVVKLPKEIWMVKLADRIVNLNPPPEYWDKAKRRQYYEQSFIIYDRLKDSHFDLGERLKIKIENYKQYF